MIGNLRILKYLKFKLDEVLNDIRGECEILPNELLDSIAKAMVPFIRDFYNSKEGKEYFEKWSEKREKSTSAHSTKNADKCILTPKEAV